MQAPSPTSPCADRGPDAPRMMHLLSAVWRPPRCLAVFPGPCRPSGDIHRRSGGKLVRIPGNRPFDVWHIHRRKPHKFPHRSGKSRQPFHCPVPCMPPPDGKFVRNPYRAQCSGPSVWGLAPEGRKQRNDHTLRHSHCRLRCRIGIVDAPWSSPKNEGFIAREVQARGICLKPWADEKGVL